MLKNKVLVVGMDGLRFDRIAAVGAPVLLGLMATGAHGTSLLPYGEADAAHTGAKGQRVPVGPGGSRTISSRTDSGPGWSSIATGVWPDKHGVVDNLFTNADYTKFPDFLTRAKAANPDLDVAALFSWAELDRHGAFSGDIGTRVVLNGYTLTFTEADRRIAGLAESHLASAGTDLTFVYFGDTDEVAHQLGPLCPEFEAALLAQDAYLGRLLHAIGSRPSYDTERWTVLITTDHGHVDAGGHGGVSDEERTTFVIGARMGEDLGGLRLGEARLVDVAPTALAALGVEVDPTWALDGVALRF
ncbi:alkaline phosphatase family protein [Nonomuraea sp. NBC_01738]|uniref:alkaline phosphatase family protein n=1 Tax=Nonomuraea sp. NBC_01738 TaxID=2976003 RepID=UPI002E13E312|nr:alkaline phosphatase family protein [Nonomuraea sp. NBC_01738]